jgi:hypothetical protein
MSERPNVPCKECRYTADLFFSRAAWVMEALKYRIVMFR